MRKITILILTSVSVIFADPLLDLVSKDGILLGYENGVIVGYSHHISYPFFPVDPIASLTGCDPSFLKAIMRAESNFKVHALSWAKAMGVSQFVPSTASWIGLSNPFNPIFSTFKTCEYLKYLEKRFDTKEEVLWAYHDGEGNVRRKGPSRSARIYSERVLRYYEEYSSYERVEYFRDDLVFNLSLKIGKEGISVIFEGIGSIFGSIDADLTVEAPKGDWSIRIYPRLLWYFVPYLEYDGKTSFGVSILSWDLVNLDVNPFKPSFEISFWNLRIGFDEDPYVIYRF